ncbi:hypothetical protein UK99_11370, partial [Frankia casuarinae]
MAARTDGDDHVLDHDRGRPRASRSTDPPTMQVRRQLRPDLEPDPMPSGTRDEAWPLPVSGAGPGGEPVTDAYPYPDPAFDRRLHAYPGRNRGAGDDHDLEGQERRADPGPRPVVPRPQALP